MPTDPDAAADAPQNQDQVLRRILTAVEKDRRRGRLELILAIILSVATLASTWCGYQARQWGGLQGGKQAAADTTERKSAEDTIAGLQLRTFDGIILLELWRTMRAQDQATADAILAHMRPALRRAVDAAVAEGVLHDPSVPGPLQRPEYILPQEQEAARLRDEAIQLQAGAREAGHAAGSYVLLTLMFATVLFFGGITGTFTEPRVRRGLALVALALFLTTMAFLLRLPVCPK